MSYSYQWKRGGVAIPGATSSSYLLVTADLAAMISCTVTATNVAGSANATAAAVGPVTAAAANSITASAGAFALSGKSATLTKTTPASYTGPGEITGWDTAYGYWGLRAYNTSKIGANCIDICSNQYDTPLNPFTLVIGSDGYVDVSSLPAYTPIYISKIYDQIGTQHLSAVFGTTNRPTLVANKVGGKHAMLFAGGEGCSSSGVAVAQAQPVTIGAVIIATGSGRAMSDGSVNWMPLVFNATGDQVGHQFGVYTQFYPGLATGTVGSYISIAASTPLPTGGSSSMSVNGTITPTPGNVGINGIGTTNKLTMGGNDAGGGQLIGYVYEVIIKAGKKDATEQGALTTNQRAIGTGF